MNESVKDRLLQFLKATGIKKGTFEKRCGFSNGYMNQLRHEPSREKIEIIISKYPELNFKWLMTGEGKMMVELAPDLSKGTARVIEVYNKSGKAKKEEPEKEKKAEHGVPFFNVDFELGFDLLVNDQTTVPEYFNNFAPYNRCTAWCTVSGNSMYPTIASGDLVALTRIEDFRYLISGEVYAFVTANGLRTIKRVKDNGDTFTLIPDNKEYPEQTLPKSEFTHVFRVNGTMKRF